MPLTPQPACGPEGVTGGCTAFNCDTYPSFNALQPTLWEGSSDLCSLTWIFLWHHSVTYHSTSQNTQ